MLGATAASDSLRRTVLVRVAASLPAEDSLTGMLRNAINSETPAHALAVQTCHL